MSESQEARADALHAEALGHLKRGEAPLAKAALRREWALRKQMPQNPTKLVECYLHLALVRDGLGNRQAATALLAAATQICRQETVPAEICDLVFRLYASCLAHAGHVLQARNCLLWADSLNAGIHEVSALQVYLEWTDAICTTGLRMLHQRTTLADVLGYALSDRVRRELFAYLGHFNGFSFAIAHTRARHLAVLSSAAVLRILDEAPQIEHTAVDRAIEGNNYGNALLSVKQYAEARKVFAQIVETNLPDLATSADGYLAYQVGLAYAGVGYSYHNDARDSEGIVHIRALVEADRAFAKAIDIHALLGGEYRRAFHFCRLYACSAVVSAKLDRESEAHRRFAHAIILASDRQYDASALLDIPCRDEDIFVKYGEALHTLGKEHTAVLFEKCGVRAAHANSLVAHGGETDAPFAQEYVRSRHESHRSLIDRLIGLGRHNEAEQAYELLKLDAHALFEDRRSSAVEVESRVSTVSAERSAIEAVGLVDAIKTATCRDRDDASIEAVGTALQGLEERIARAFEVSSVSSSEEAGAYRLMNRLGHSAALVQYLVRPEGLRIVLTVAGGRHARFVSITAQSLARLVFRLRMTCRHEMSSNPEEFIELAQLLHEVLIAPVQSLFPESLKELYVQVDQSLAGVPFCALHDGKTYLVERFSIAYFNPAGKREGARLATAHLQKRLAIFACSSVSGASLPGAAREGRVIAQHVREHRHDWLLAEYEGSGCTASAFIDELQRPFGPHGILHLATHADFNPHSDALSVLSFADSALSLRRMRETALRDGCDAGLFVLSACGTARWDVDVEGFSVSLLKAGVGAVLASLWETFDASGADFFQAFYRQCEDPSSARAVAEAVRISQCEMLLHEPIRKGGVPLQHPAHWAPYVVTVGEIQLPAPRSVCTA